MIMSMVMMLRTTALVSMAMSSRYAAFGTHGCMSRSSRASFDELDGVVYNTIRYQGRNVLLHGLGAARECNNQSIANGASNGSGEGGEGCMLQ